MSYHTCPACGHAYATEADWLACSYPANGRDLQDDCGGGLLRLRLCVGCESSMAKPVANVAALAIELQAEAQERAACLAAAADCADRLRDQVRLAYAHIGAAAAQLVDEDDDGIANHIRAAALILRGRS